MPVNSSSKEVQGKGTFSCEGLPDKHLPHWLGEAHHQVLRLADRFQPVSNLVEAQPFIS